jgi:hypothetical protein
VGHSEEVLLRVYADCIDGDADQHNNRIADASGGGSGTPGMARGHQGSGPRGDDSEAGQSATTSRLLPSHVVQTPSSPVSLAG